MAFTPQMEAFRVSSNAIGIDMDRSQYSRNLGIYVANATTTFRAGMLVQLNSSQEIEICGNGGATNPFGFAKYNKTNVLYANIVGEQIQLTGLVATNLKHSNLWVRGAADGVRVYNLTTGTSYTEGAAADYTANYTNGQIARVAATTIVDGQIVGVDYAYQVTEAQYKYEGRNFWNFTNDVDIQDGKITVINDWSLIFTTQYDVAQTYAVNDTLNAGTSADTMSGLVTKGGAGPYIGKVFQVPTATDPFLGIQYVGGPIAQKGTCDNVESI